MRGSEDQAHVLYCDVVDSEEGSGAVGRLQALCDAAVRRFAAAGLALPADCARGLKLHATLINTRYRQAQRGRGAAGGWQRQAVDARALMQRHGDVDLGEVEVREMHLSQRGVFNAGDGYYKTACRLPLGPPD